MESNLASAHFETASWMLCALAAAAAGLYGLVFEQKPPSLLRALVKTAFLAALAGAFARAHAPGLFIAGLIAAAIGDFFLAFDKPIVLPLGMIAFLIMQALYIVTYLQYALDAPDQTTARFAIAALIGAVVFGYLVWFWREARPGRSAILAVLAIAGAFAIGGAPVVLALTGRVDMRPGAINIELNGVAALAVFVAAIAFIWLRRDLGAVKLAGMVYAAVILQMAFVSLCLPWSGWPVMLGAFFFLVSDGVLSAELFRLAPEAKARAITGPVVWWTYAAAQLLIAFGVARLAWSG